MAVSTKQLLQLKEAAKEAEEQRIRAESARDEALKQLKELGYESIKEAEQALHDMQQDIIDEEAKLEEQIQELLDEYPELL